jgi:hypothetical protein
MGMLKTFLGHHFRPRADEKGPLAPSADRQILEWVAQGLPAPPPHAIKQAVVRAYARRYGTRVLVETGTYFGDMVAAMKHDFARIYSIELSEQLYAQAVTRFRGDPAIVLIQGDSSEAIARVLAELNEPALFWLDGHWSSGVTARGSFDTPVREEIKAILAARDLRHVILIDDARLFGTDPAYPTVEDLRAQIRAHRPQLEFAMDADIVRVTPPIGGALA